MIDLDAPVALAELAAVSGCDVEDLRGFAAGPFAPDGDRMRLRAALGAHIIVAFGLRHLTLPETAVGIAAEAAAGAALGADRSLVVVWRGRQPQCCWIEGDPARPPVGAREAMGAPLRLPMVVVPVDRMAQDLTLAIVQLRRRGRMEVH